MDDFRASPGRIWLIPEPARYETWDDTPIFAALFFRHFPIRFLLGSTPNGDTPDV